MIALLQGDEELHIIVFACLKITLMAFSKILLSGDMLCL